MIVVQGDQSLFTAALAFKRSRAALVFEDLGFPDSSVSNPLWLNAEASLMQASALCDYKRKKGQQRGRHHESWKFCS